MREGGRLLKENKNVSLKAPPDIALTACTYSESLNLPSWFRSAFKSCEWQPAVASAEGENRPSNENNINRITEDILMILMEVRIDLDGIIGR